jgi:aryl-alcohol dehydrogenase-like predicted oxidoreductase
LQSFGAGGGNFTNEELVGKAIARYGRDKLIIATKFGILFKDGHMGSSGSEETLRSQLADSLSRLGTSYIDLYYMHRMDPSTPIEETMRVLKGLVEEGVIRYIGLSECTPDELRRAHAVHPITAIQMEWSLQTRDIEADIVPCARELGVGIVAYSPLGRSFLTAANAATNLAEGDWRKTLPRFAGDNLEANQQNLQPFFDMAQRKGCTPAQLALAWVQAQGDDVFPIPGTKTPSRVEENIKALEVLESLSVEEVKLLSETVKCVGDRYAADAMRTTFNSRV